MSCYYGDKTRGGGGGILKLQADVSQQETADGAEQAKQASSQNPSTLFSMYIKFWRRYGEDKKDEASAELSPESQLSVELEQEKGKQTEEKTRLYRAACLLLTVICLVLLLVVIFLSVKLQTGSTVCPEREEATPPGRPATAAAACSYEQCQALFPHIQLQYLGCRQCADGWLTFGRSCFYLSTFRLSWDESQRNCSSRGGSLAVISSPGIQSFLTKEGKMKYWVGLRQYGNRWTWVNNTALQESYWADGSQRGDCAILDGGSPSEKSWVKAPCQAYTYFICQL